MDSEPPSFQCYAASEQGNDDVLITHTSVPPRPLLPPTANQSLAPSQSSSMTWMRPQSNLPQSPNHPIVIKDDKCTRCEQVGHVYDDCNTPLKVPGECEVCKWTRQAECNHYEPTPARLRELRQKFGQRMRRLAIQEALFPSQ